MERGLLHSSVESSLDHSVPAVPPVKQVQLRKSARLVNTVPTAQSGLCHDTHCILSQSQLFEEAVIGSEALTVQATFGPPPPMLSQQSSGLASFLWPGVLPKLAGMACT